MQWACAMLVCALILASSTAWTSSPFADAGRILPGATQTLPLPGSEAKKWYPISGAIFGWSRVANKEDEAEKVRPLDKLLWRSRVVERADDAEETHPAEKLLRRQKADMTESYILGGY